jgi:hypothetical protein
MMPMRHHTEMLAETPFDMVAGDLPRDGQPCGSEKADLYDLTVLGVQPLA